MSTAAAPETAPSSDPRPTTRRRRDVPAGVYMEQGVAGRVLVFLWSMAPWSQGPVAFVWPKLSTIAGALDLWPSQVDKAIRYLKEIRWIRRETRKVRFEGRMVDRLGFVLFDEPSNGPLWEWLRREDEAGEVVVSTPLGVGRPTPPRVGTSSLEEQETNKNSSSAGAREAEPRFAQEEKVWKVDTTPPAPTRPQPTPIPEPDLPPAAEGVDTDLWHEAEHQRVEALGGIVARPATEMRRAGVRRLIAHVEREELVGRDRAIARVRLFTETATHNAAREVRERGKWAATFVDRRLRAPFDTRTYDAVMGREAVHDAREHRRKASAWSSAPQATPEPPPPTKPSTMPDDYGAEAFLATLRERQES